MSTKAPTIVLTVQTLAGRAIIEEVPFPVESAVGSVKDEVCSVAGIPKRQQRLLWDTAVLEDHRLIGEFGPPGSCATLQLVLYRPSEEQVTEVHRIVGLASETLNSLDRKSVSELKAMKTPPAVVAQVLYVVQHLLVGIDPAISVGTRGRPKDSSWLALQKMLTSPTKFCKHLESFKTCIDEGRASHHGIAAVQAILAEPHFHPDSIKSTSKAAADLARWVINIIRYREIVAKLREDFEDIDNIMAEIQAME